MTETIGTARLDIVVDTTNMEAGVAKAKRAQEDLGAAAQRSSQTQEQASKRAQDATRRAVETFGKSRDEVLKWQIAQRFAGEEATKLTAKVDAQVAKLNAGAAAFNKYGLSAKQQAAALRGVPAQVTDIFTSLASGQRPLTVLLQQGGQLKDLFGGIVPAARALGGAILGLINPYTLAAAAIVGIGLAWKQAADEGDAFDRALILTGQSAGLTTERLRAMAAEIDAASAVSGGKAAEAVAAAGATGKFTADQIKLVADAAANLENATGRAIEKTIADFVELEKAPVDAILKLNDAVGDGTNVTNFLTEAQIKAIDKFKEQGKEAEATAIAVKAYADAINDRSGEVVDNLNAWTELWRGLKEGVVGAGNAVVNFMRDSEASQAMARSLQRAFLMPGGFVDPNRPSFKGVTGKVTGDQPSSIVDSQAFKARKDAEKEFAQLSEQNLSKQEKHLAEIARIRELGVKAGKSQLEIDKEIAKENARFKESLPKGRKPKKENTRGIENASDRFDDMVGRFQSELQGPLEKAEQEHLKRMREIQQAARDGKRSHEDLAKALDLEGQAYANTKRQIEERFQAEIAGLSGPIVQAQAEHEAALRRIEELKNSGQATGAQYNAMLAEEAKRHDEAAAAAQRAADPIGALLSDMAFEIDFIGKSNAERAVMIELRRQNIDAMSAEGQAALATARTFEEEAKAKQRSIDLMDTFRQGAADALTDFVTGAKSAKEAFKDFFDDLARRITQMIAEKWIEKAFGAMGSDGSGTQGGGWIAAIASLFANANGNAFNNGQVMAFANGGVVNGPTLFPMQGRTGLMGEAGPEAIVPLKRGPNGRLGVENFASDSKRGGDVTFHQTVVVQERTNRKTEEQYERRTGRAIRRGLQRTG